MTGIRHAPISVEVTRGPKVESRHLVDAMIMRSDGQVLSEWGECEHRIFPRSAIKIMQAIPLVESGAADAAEYSDADLAIACASHGGEAQHVDRVGEILGRLGLVEDDLACGIHRPLIADAAIALDRAGQDATKLHNNCSGKHAGMLALAKHLAVPIEGYHLPTHPVHQAIFAAFGDMTGEDIRPQDMAFDGCGVPTIALPMRSLALAAARVADPSGLPEARQQAILRLRKAIMDHPAMVGGTGRFDTEIMTALSGTVFCKVGAEAVEFIALPDQGIGMVLKARCGSERAVYAAAAWLIAKLADTAGSDVVERWQNRELKNSLGDGVGVIRVDRETPPPVTSKPGFG